MDTKRLIKFLANAIYKIARSRNGYCGLQYEDWVALEALRNGDFSAFEDKEEQKS